MGELPLIEAPRRHKGSAQGSLTAARPTKVEKLVSKVARESVHMSMIALTRPQSSPLRRRAIAPNAPRPPPLHPVLDPHNKRYAPKPQPPNETAPPEHASGARDVRRDAVHDGPAAGSVADRPRAPRRPRQRRGGRGIVGARRHFSVEFSLAVAPFTISVPLFRILSPAFRSFRSDPSTLPRSRCATWIAVHRST